MDHIIGGVTRVGALLAAALAIVACAEQTVPADGASVASAIESLPEGRYRCYILRAGEGGTLTPTQDPGAGTGAGMSGVLGKYQGHLNILPGQAYDWFGSEENRGTYEFDADTGEIEWVGGTFGDGSVSAVLGQNDEGTPVIRMHYTFDDGTSLDHSCRLSKRS